MRPAKHFQDPAEHELLRHTLATLAYRARKALRDAPAGFSDFHVSETSRTPGQILAHLGDLLDWAVSIVRGREEWRDSQTLSWKEGVSRFYESLKSLDDCLASERLAVPAAKLFQGAIADAFTHVGQIAMLRRIAGAPIRGENYFRAEIVVGRVGLVQAEPQREFD